MVPMNETVSMNIPSPIVRMAENSARALGVDLAGFTQMAWIAFMSNVSTHSTLQSTMATSVELPRTEDVKAKGPFSTYNLDDLEEISNPMVPALHVVRDRILWGQFNRFLPIKYTLRVLHSLTANDSPPRLIEWQEAVRASSIGIQKHLRGLDEKLRIRRGAQLAAGFPRSFDDDEDRTVNSMNRFLNHYTAVIQGDGIGPVVGMLAELGFISLDLASSTVNLTPAGLDYSNLENPQMDNSEKTKQSMSEEEAEFMMDHVQKVLPEEWKFLMDILTWIDAGCNEPKTLRENAMAMRGPGTHQDWSEKELPTYVNGALGRLTEMGLISRQWETRRVSYHLTQKAKLLIGEVA